jgi:hypothetical protein
LGASRNTLFPNNFVVLNGGTLDLNGTTQYISGLLTDSSIAGAGGRVLGVAATGTLVANQDNTARSFAGTLEGAFTFNRTGSNTLTITNESPLFTGNLLLNNATTTLADSGALTGLTGSSTVDINYATLNLSNQGLIDLSNRLDNDAAINLRGGSLTLLGRAQAASTETVGAVTIAQGASTITATAGGTGINSADLTLTSLARTAGATVNFGATGQIGSNGRILISSAPTLTSNSLFGAWAIVNGSDYASYNSSFGVGAVGSTGFRAYEGTFASGNVTQITATTNLSDPTTTTGVLRLNAAATLDVGFTVAGNTLVLEQGGLLRSNNNNASTIGVAGLGLFPGVLTAGTGAGTTELIAYNASNTMTISVETPTCAPGNSLRPVSRRMRPAGQVAAVAPVTLGVKVPVVTYVVWFVETL